MKKVFLSLKKTVTRFLLIVFGISFTLGVIFFFRWIGLKGFIGFTVGVLLAGILLMSDHPYIQAYREHMGLR